MILVLMGVSGCGKTTIGRLLSERLGWEFHDGDTFHSPEMKEKMRSGIPLNDDDRRPWLERLAALMRDAAGEGRSVIVGCSALRECYRTILKGDTREVRFVHLKGSAGLIASRLAVRAHEFMNPALLQSQFDTLEAPSDALDISIDAVPEEIVESIIGRLGLESTAV